MPHQADTKWKLNLAIAEKQSPGTAGGSSGRDGVMRGMMKAAHTCPGEVCPELLGETNSAPGIPPHPGCAPGEDESLLSGRGTLVSALSFELKTKRILESLFLAGREVLFSADMRAFIF